jgi:hypothetical protein
VGRRGQAHHRARSDRIDERRPEVPVSP